MKHLRKENKQVSRRKFIGLSTAAVTFVMIPSICKVEPNLQQNRSGKPNSIFGGIQIGTTNYSWRSLPGSTDDTLNYCIKCDINSIELNGNVPEQYAGIPQLPAKPANNTTEAGKATYQKVLTEVVEAQRKWRITAPYKMFEDFRKKYNDAGVNIHLISFSQLENWSDEEIDYAYRMAKTLGAKGIITEIGEKSAQKLGPFAQKQGLYNVMHQHLQPGDPEWSFDKFLAYSPVNMLNFDAGHYFGATGLHPNDIIQRLHHRMVSIHLKDKTGPKGSPANTNMLWGKGETPIADILLLLKKERWPIYADIELEYPIPEGSDAISEVKKCVEFCRNILS